MPSLNTYDTPCGLCDCDPCPCDSTTADAHPPIYSHSQSQNLSQVSHLADKLQQRAEAGMQQGEGRVGRCCPPNLLHTRCFNTGHGILLLLAARAPPTRPPLFSVPTNMQSPTHACTRFPSSFHVSCSLLCTALRAVASALGSPREPTMDDMIWAHCVFWSRGQSLPVPNQPGAGGQCCVSQLLGSTPAPLVRHAPCSDLQGKMQWCEVQCVLQSCRAHAAGRTVFQCVPRVSVCYGSPRSEVFRVCRN